MKSLSYALALGLIGTFAWLDGASAAEHEVKMLNKGADNQLMVFEPAYLRVQPGDTVKFLPSDKSHNSEVIPTMVPEGGETWKGKMNEAVSVTFTKPGLYGYKCLPHYGMGMVGLIQVGDDAANLDQAAAVKHPGQAQKRMQAQLQQVDAGKTASVR